MTSDETPHAPDGSPLTPEEWDAVRRLRGERGGSPAPAAPGTPPPAAQPATPHVPDPAEPAEPVTAPAPLTAAEPVEPVAPVTPTATVEAPRWGGARHRPAAGRASAALTAVSLLLLFAVMAAVLVTLVTAHLSARRASSNDATDAIAAATGGVATVLSYNYRSLDHDFARAESLLTPSFRKTYITTTAKAVQPLAAKYKAVSSAQVTAAGVVTSGGGRVEVLVFVDQVVTNSQLPKPRLDRSRIDVELVHTGDRWLINKLSPV